jgi:hypothetical protein
MTEVELNVQPALGGFGACSFLCTLMWLLPQRRERSVVAAWLL